MNYQYRYLALTLNGDSYAESRQNTDNLIDLSGQFAITLWIRVGSNFRKRIIVSQEDVFSLFIDDNILYFQFNNGAPVCSDKEHVVCDEQWHYICVSMVESFMYMYVDGELCGMTSICMNVNKANNPLMFGKGLVGQIREVKIYRNALYADEIGKTMFAEPDISQLQAWYDFTENPALEKCNNATVDLFKGATIGEFSIVGNFNNGSFVSLEEQNGFLECLEKDFSLQLCFRFSPASTDENTYTIFSVCNTAKTVGAKLYIEKNNSMYSVRFHYGPEEMIENIVSYNGLRVDEWTNIAVIKRLDRLYMYVNGYCNEDTTLEGLFPITGCAGEEQVLFIGSDAFSSYLNGDNMFEGNISRLDLWNTWLTDDEVMTYLDQTPVLTDTRLVASCDFTSSIPFNAVGTELICGMNSFDTEECEKVASKGVKETRRMLRDEEEPLTAEQLSKLRAKVFGLRSGMNDNTGKFPVVNSMCYGENYYFVMHNKERSYTVASISVKELRTHSECMAMSDEELVWWVELILMILEGVFLIAFGLHINKSKEVVAYVINKILYIPQIRILFNGGVTFFTIVSFFKLISKRGLILPLLKLCVNVSYFIILKCFCSLLKLATGGLLIADSALLIAQVIIHLRNKPTPVTKLMLSSILFNYKGNPATLSIEDKNLFTDYTPEWNGKNIHPVLFNIDKAKGKNITVVASFLTESIENVWLRAIDRTKTVILGNSEEINIDMKKDKANEVKFKFPSHKLADLGILKEKLQIEWQYSNDRKVWKSICSSNHNVYTVLSTPFSPWDYTSTPYKGISLKPVASLLDSMYPYLKGIKDFNSLYKKVTETINASLGFYYDKTRGKSSFILYITGRNECKFDISGFIHCLSNKFISRVNCSDCANMVVIVSNIYGGKLKVLKIGFDFVCNEIKAIGFDNWECPFPNSGKRFHFHDIAIEGIIPVVNYKSIKVYDACLKVDDSCLIVDDSSNLKRSHGNAVLPTGMRFSAQEKIDAYITPLPDDSYLEHLVARGEEGLKKCNVYEQVYLYF